MENSTSSVSFSLSKNDLNEELSFYDAFQSDAQSRLGTEEEQPAAISNEQIRNGDSILETYKVVSDPIHGGMGSVWRVHHEGWDMDLAMKRPQPRFFAEGSAQRKKRFVEECENWIDLGLQMNIVSCYYVREVGGVPTVFSEWMDNGSIKDRIRDGALYTGGERAAQERILDIAIQTARGLAFSHAHKLIHQDVKPGNLLLTKEWDAKVADFGLAQAAVEPAKGFGFLRKLLKGAGGNAGAGSQAGGSSGYTPEYCPKEQAGGAKAEAWMDVYAWALTVLEMYAGKRLWETGAQAKQILESCFSQCRIPVPEEMKALIRRCLAERKLGFSAIAALLEDIYKTVTGYSYARLDEAQASATADSLNNKALSFLDLGKPELSEKLWGEALTRYPEHVDSLFNRELFMVRTSRETERKAVENLQKHRATRDTDLGEQIEKECGGGEIREPDHIYRFDNKNGQVFADKDCHDICVSSFAFGNGKLYLPTYEQDKKKYHWHLRGIKRVAVNDPDDWDIIPIVDVPDDFREGLVMRFIIHPGKGYAAIFDGGRLIMYDMDQRKMIADRDISNGSGDGGFSWGNYQDKPQVICFSRDGSMFGIGRKVYDQHKKKYFYRTILLEPETLRDVKEWIQVKWEQREGLRFVGFGSRNEALMRSENALFSFDRENGLREIVSFDSKITDTLESDPDNPLFLACRLQNGKAFRYDETEGPVQVTSRLFDFKKDVVFFDKENGLLYRMADTLNFGLAVWDLNRQKRLFTAGVKAMDNTGMVWDDNTGRLLFVYRNPRCVEWFFLPLPERMKDHKPAMWRVSGITTAHQRTEEERKIRESVREFEKCVEQGDTAGAIEIHRECCGIEGFAATPQADRMEDYLERKAARDQLIGVWPVREIDGLPILGAGSCRLYRTGDGRIAMWDEKCYETDRKGIALFHEDMTNARFVPIPDPAMKEKPYFYPLIVRGTRVFGFMEDLRYAVYDLNGKLLKTPKEGWVKKEEKVDLYSFSFREGNEEFEKWKASAPKYKDDYLDTDSAGRYCLFLRKSRIRTGDDYLYVKELETGEDIRICQYFRERCRDHRFLQDDTVIAGGQGKLWKFRLQDGQLVLLKSWTVPVEGADSWRFEPSWEKDRIIVRKKCNRHEDDHTFVYDCDGNLLHDVKGTAAEGVLTMGGRFVFYSDLSVYDLFEEKVVCKIVPEFESIGALFRPDGREVYVRHRDETKHLGRGNTVTVYKIGYNYSCSNCCSSVLSDAHEG